MHNSCGAGQGVDVFLGWNSYPPHHDPGRFQILMEDGHWIEFTSCYIQVQRRIPLGGGLMMNEQRELN